MLKNILTVFVVLSISAGSRSQESEKKMIKCLLENQLYHEDAGDCGEPLQQGSCGDGQWLNIVTSRPGTVTCQRRPRELVSCSRPVIGADGEVVCDTEPPFQPCSRGRVKIPDNFRLNTKPCPSGFTCQPRNQVYWSSLKQFRANKIVGVSEIEFLKSLVCDADSKQICLPDNNSDNLLSVKNILQSYRTPSQSCQANPCPPGSWPWLDDGGYFRCLPGDADVDSCQFTVEEEGGRVVCSLFDFRSIIPVQRRRCRRRQVFMWGKCYPRWG